MQLRQTERGFTIFEVLIYIALFTIIIGGGISAAFQIFQGSAQVQAMAQRETELNFVLRKIDWALNGATSVSVSGDGNTLTVLKESIAYDFTTNGETVTMEFSSDLYDLTSRRISISDIDFALDGGDPEILDITMTIDEDAVGPIKRYVR